MPRVSRRQSIRIFSSTLAGSALAGGVPRAQPTFRFGYAAITWGGNDRQAITDIADVGFRGIQLRSAAVDTFGDRPRELKGLLDARGLTLVALSSGTIGIEAARADEEIALHLKHARFLREAGGLYLQVIDRRPPQPATPADYAAMGRRLTELGKQTADYGIPLGYHHHMGSLGEAPDEIDRILDAADPAFVKLELDIAHYLQGGGDPAAAIRRYASWLLFLHIKDVRARTPEPGARDRRPYQFVELGRGRVDVPAVFRALVDVAFAGWLIVELDAVPEPGQTPRASAETNRDYITRELGLPL